VCDDLKVRVAGNRIVAAEGACFLAEPWFLDQGASDSPPALIDGKGAELEAAIERAAMILSESRAPLIYGLSRSSTPGQRAAVCLADRLGATIDTTASTCHAPSIMALQSVGESTSTLGEVKNRADLVIYWGSNPLESHPRHMQLFVDSAGMFVPGGRRNRHLIVVDVKQTETAELADTFIKIKPGGDFELIWALRLLCQQGLEANSLNQESPLDLLKDIAGVPLEQIQSMAQRMMRCDYGGVFFGLGLSSQNTAHTSVEALLRLVTDLNAHTRFVVRRMRVPGDVAGADSVLCWQTGFPFSVNLSRGYPRFNPGEYTAATLLER